MQHSDWPGGNDAPQTVSKTRALLRWFPAHFCHCIKDNVEYWKRGLTLSSVIVLSFKNSPVAVEVSQWLQLNSQSDSLCPKPSAGRIFELGGKGGWTFFLNLGSIRPRLCCITQQRGLKKTGSNGTMCANKGQCHCRDTQEPTTGTHPKQFSYYSQANAKPSKKKKTFSPILTMGC